jgi:hypothetical protein
MKDLLHPFDQSPLLELAIGRGDKTLSNLHAVNIQADGFRYCQFSIADCQSAINTPIR